MATVAELKVGESGIIREFVDAEIPIKLVELGCLPGNLVILLQIAPLRDPLYVDINGSHLAIRREIAQRIEVDICAQVQVS